MNFLFYLGIIVPTVITITLFVVFIYCWFLQKARKEVLTQKYDPHGKMRRLGLSLDPPPPPDYCRGPADAFLQDGQDNVAYDVSRSPSTEQDARGRPMYHTYHDSGISAGLSPSQDTAPRPPGLAYRTCPDSGISGFGPPGPCHQCYASTSGGAVQPDLRQQPHADNRPPEPSQYHRQQVHQAVLHHNLVPASVHPSHGVCYGDNTEHPLSPQHYTPPVIHHPPNGLNLARFHDHQAHLLSQLHNTSPTAVAPHLHPRLCPYPGYQYHPHNNQQCYLAGKPTGHPSNNLNMPPSEAHEATNQAISSPKDSHSTNRTHTLQSSLNLHAQQNNLFGSKSQCSASSPTEDCRHSPRDCDTLAQSAIASLDRPDSQASQSSTTDSEDSGFRSSYRAAHNQTMLSKQGNPLLKPFRRTRNKSKPYRRAASNEDILYPQGGTPLTTLNPQNLQICPDVSDIKNTSLMDLDMAHRPSRVPNSNAPPSKDRFPISASSKTSPSDTPLVFRNSSHRLQEHSPDREKLAAASTKGEEAQPSLNNHSTEISTHLSWKYLQAVSSSNSGACPPSTGVQGGILLQPCSQGAPATKMLQSNPDQNLEMFGFSVV